MIILQKITYLYHKQIGYLIYYIMFSKCELVYLNFFIFRLTSRIRPFFLQNLQRFILFLYSVLICHIGFFRTIYPATLQQGRIFGKFTLRYANKLHSLFL